MKSLLFAAATAFFATTASGAVIEATESYYTFGSGVSSNQERLLADKAQEIGFPGLETISFILFDLSTFSEPSRPYTVTLEMEQDSDLAGTLIPAMPDRLLTVGAYGLDGTWDPVGGNLADARYGTNGDAAFDLVDIGANGIYNWDITQLFREWITTPTTETAIVLTGLFGNVNTDDRNTYASFYAANSDAGFGPQLVITPVPIPSGVPLILAALTFLGFVRLRQSSQ